MSNNRTYYSEEMLINQSFIMFPKWLMMDPEFSKLSNDAKVLYVNLKDRYRLSLKNNWVDKEGRAFLVCKRTSMETMLHKTDKTIKKIMQELIDCKLLIEKRNGMSKPNHIYLLTPSFKNYDEPQFEEDNYIVEEFINNSSEGLEENKTERVTRKNSDSRNEENPIHDKENFRENSNNNSRNNKLLIKESKNLNANIQNSIENSYDENLKLLEDIQKEIVRKYELLPGIFLTDKQLNDVNELVKMIGSGELNSSKDNLMKYIAELSHRDFKDRKGNKIKSLKSYVSMNFKLRSDQMKEEMEFIKKLADEGDFFAQNIINKKTPDYKVFKKEKQ